MVEETSLKPDDEVSPSIEETKEQEKGEVGGRDIPHDDGLKLDTKPPPFKTRNDDSISKKKSSMKNAPRATTPGVSYVSNNKGETGVEEEPEDFNQSQTLPTPPVQNASPVLVREPSGKQFEGSKDPLMSKSSVVSSASSNRKWISQRTERRGFSGLFRNSKRNRKPPTRDMSSLSANSASDRVGKAEVTTPDTETAPVEVARKSTSTKMLKEQLSRERRERHAAARKIPGAVYVSGGLSNYSSGRKTSPMRSNMSMQPGLKDDRDYEDDDHEDEEDEDDEDDENEMKPAPISQIAQEKVKQAEARRARHAKRRAQGASPPRPGAQRVDGGTGDVDEITEKVRDYSVGTGRASLDTGESLDNRGGKEGIPIPPSVEVGNNEQLKSIDDKLDVMFGDGSTQMHRGSEGPPAVAGVANVEPADLVNAFLVGEDPDGPVMATAVRDNKRRRQAIYACAIIVVIALIVGIVVSVTQSRGNDFVPPTTMPSEAPSQSPTYSLDGLSSLLASFSGDNGTALADPETPQHEAFLWLSTNRDLVTFTVERLLQRFALATIYFAMDGERWFDNTGWLSDDNECNWYFAESPPCNEQGVIAKVGMRFNFLGGSIPPEIGLLTHVVALDLSSNTVQGEIPSEITQLTHLETLFLSSNRLTGVLPQQLPLLTSLRLFAVDNNQMFGALPEGVGNLTDLALISMHKNGFSGTIPTDIGQMTSLRKFTFSENSLEGTIPSEIGGATLLGEIEGYSNELTGTIPTEIGLLTALWKIDFESNMLQGSVPTEMQLLTALEFLYLPRNELTGTLPPGFANFSLLRQFSMAENTFSGQLPSMTLWKNVKEVDVVLNQFSGTIPSGIEQLQKAEIVLLWSNNIGGTIPTGIGNLTSAELLWLDINSLGGAIPSEFGLLTNLVNLELDSNTLSGTVPTEIGNMSSLRRLNLKDNRFTGTIPSELGRITRSTVLRLNVNQLTGTIPDAFFSLTSLSDLQLNDNNLSGVLPSTVIGSLTNLVTLDVSTNQLIGSIPSEVGNLTSLRFLRLNDNLLSGEIPTEIQNCTSLTELQLGNNDLVGMLPSALSLLSSLTILRIEQNSFSGNVSNEVCGIINAFQGELYADCGEIICPCCTRCCVRGVCAPP